MDTSRHHTSDEGEATINETTALLAELSEDIEQSVTPKLMLELSQIERSNRYMKWAILH